MWIFQSALDKDKNFIILPNKNYVIGRRDCDIVIENDQCVSRQHAILRATPLEMSDDNGRVVNKAVTSTLALSDISKFGTFVNNRKIAKQEIRLERFDEIRFGTVQSLYVVLCKPYIVCMSSLNGCGKKEVRHLLNELGGRAVNEWSNDCCLLVMKSVTVTIKVVCALLSLKPIVTPDYLRDFLRYLKKERALKPDPINYLPCVTEGFVKPDVSFHCITERSSMFSEITFYFWCEKQFFEMSKAIILGGGKTSLIKDSKISKLETYVGDKAVVMSPALNETVDKAMKAFLEMVRSRLVECGKRMVQDAEVGYAVLYCSTEEFCNPGKDISHIMPVPVMSQSAKCIAASGSRAIGDSVASQPESQLRADKNRSLCPGIFRETESDGFVGDEGREMRGDESLTAIPDSCVEDHSGIIHSDCRLGIKSTPHIPLTPDIDIRAVPDTCAHQITGKCFVKDSAPSATCSTLQQPGKCFVKDSAPSATCGTLQQPGKCFVMDSAPSATCSTLQQPGKCFVKDSAPSATCSTLQQPGKCFVKDSAPSETCSTLQQPGKCFVKDSDPSETCSTLQQPGPELLQLSQIKREYVEDQQVHQSSIVCREDKNGFRVVSLSPPKRKRCVDPDDDGGGCYLDFDKKRTSSIFSSSYSFQVSPNPDIGHNRHGDTCTQSVTTDRHNRHGDTCTQSVTTDRIHTQNDFTGKQDQELSSVNDDCGSPRSFQMRRSSASNPLGFNHKDYDHNARAKTYSDDEFLSTHRQMLTHRQSSYEAEDKFEPVVVVVFENLLNRRNVASGTRARPEVEALGGLSDWNGQTVRNFKSFRKVKHHGADRLPRIIGGRDLRVYRNDGDRAVKGGLDDEQRAECPIASEQSNSKAV